MNDKQLLEGNKLKSQITRLTTYLEPTTYLVDPEVQDMVDMLRKSTKEDAHTTNGVRPPLLSNATLKRMLAVAKADIRAQRAKLQRQFSRL